MATPADLPLSRAERRSADRPAVKRKRPSDGLLRQAQTGRLTEKNTRAGTRGRQAVDAITYARRTERGRRLGLPTARAATGHAGAEPGTAMSAVFVERGFYVFPDPTLAQRARIARWNSRAGQLLAGDLAPARFRRLISQWAPLGDLTFESDPAVVIAALTQQTEGGGEPFIYEGRRT